MNNKNSERFDTAMGWVASFMVSGIFLACVLLLVVGDFQ